MSWSFIQKKTLIFFSFGPIFCEYINTLHPGGFTNVQVNGYLSDTIMIQRGCRQGDPLSPYIFILCSKILSIKIRNNKNIKGITINEDEYKLSQFADDTSLLLDGSEQSLHETLSELDSFYHMPGLKLNSENTKVIWIGSRKYSAPSIKTGWKLAWGNIRFKVLGVWFDVDLDKMITQNYNDKTEKMRKILISWKKKC